MSFPSPVEVDVSFKSSPFGGVQVFFPATAPSQIILREGTQGEPGPPGPAGPPITDLPESGATDRGTQNLLIGQVFCDVVFFTTQPDTEWLLVECRVLNTIDLSPLNIWTGIITSKTTTGFRVQLNGLPDSGNYVLHWAIAGFVPEAFPATSYFLSGPVTGPISAPSTFTVHLPPGGTVDTPVVVTPDDGGAGGTFSPTTVILTTTNFSRTFTYTPVSYGAKTISVTSDSSLTDPVPISFSPLSGTYALSGPSTGVNGVASTNFTVALPVGGVVTGTLTVTPSDGGGGGTFTPTTVGLTTGAPSATFTYTPASVGAKTISVTNNGGLTNPGSLTYTAIPVGYTSSLTVYHSKVSGTQVDFPVLVNITNAVLKTVANGGHVQRSDAFDIGFFSDSGGTTPLKWEIEKYVPTTGELVAWVKIASLSSSVDTVFYMRYGDPSITTDQSDKVNVWTNGYIAVYHLGNGTTLSGADSRNANNGTLVNTPTPTTGKIDGAGAFVSASTQYINVGHGSGFNIGGEYTFSAWINSTAWAISPLANFIVAKDTNTGRSFAFGVNQGVGGKLQLQNAGTAALLGTTVLSAATTYYVVITRNATTDTLYLNAVSDGSAVDVALPNTATDCTIGARLYPGNTEPWNGWLDEVRFANAGRSAGWVLTEYNNQNSPGTFLYFDSIGAYTLSGPAFALTGVASTDFTVTLIMGTVSGTATITPSDGAGGTFTPTTVGITNASPTATFTYTPASSGTKTISVTNDKGLTNPVSLSCAVAIDPSTVTGLKLWLKADAIAGPPADGTALATWADSSGNGNDATQASGSFKPVFKTAILNGRPIVRFDASPNYMACASMPGSPTTTASLFIVQKRFNTAGGAQVMLSIPPSPTNAFGIYLPFTDNNIYFDLGDSTATGRVSAAWGGNFTDFFAWSFVAGGGNMAVYRNGTTVVSTGGHTNSFAPAGLTLNINGSAPAAQQADIAEILIYNTALNTTDRQAVENYLRAKYALP